MSGEGQKETAPAYDINAVVGALSDDNRGFAERKGWVKDGKAVETFKLDGVFDSYRGLETKLGGKTLAAPNLADAEGFAKWEGHELLGVPGKAEDYKIERPALPDGLKWGTAPGEIAWDEAGEKMLRTALLKGQIGQTQADKVIKEIIQDRIGAITRARTDQALEKSTVEANLQKDYGAGSKAALAAGEQAFNAIAEKAKLDPNKTKDALAGLMGNEAALRFAITLGQMMGEDTLKGGGLDNGFTTSALAAKAEIEAMKADKEVGLDLADKTRPGHKATKAKWDRLWALAPQ